jgi:hypothetical protein
MSEWPRRYIRNETSMPISLRSIVFDSLRRVRRLFRKPFGLAAGLRSYQLMVQAYASEGLPLPGTSTPWGRRQFHKLPEEKRPLWLKKREPLVLLYPRSYVERVASMNHTKTIRMNFVGAVFNEEVADHRRWVVDLAASQFGDDDYFCATDLTEEYGYSRLGTFDKTIENLRSDDRRFVPTKADPADRTVFDDVYFETLSQSMFTLCPRGDLPWSMRFFEAIMCGSIPIVEDELHTGRNALERTIGYRFYLQDEALEYREDWVTENYERFVSRQTLLGRRSCMT